MEREREREKGGGWTIKEKRKRMDGDREPDSGEIDAERGANEKVTEGERKKKRYSNKRTKEAPGEGDTGRGERQTEEAVGQ